MQLSTPNEPILQHPTNEHPLSECSSALVALEADGKLAQCADAIGSSPRRRETNKKSSLLVHVNPLFRGEEQSVLICSDRNDYGTTFDTHELPSLLEQTLDTQEQAGEQAVAASIEEPLRTSAENRYILLVAYSVMFMRYCIATFLMPFFPQKAAALGISSGMNGLIFASYPLGITVTSAFSTKLIVAIGIKKSVALGCVLTFVFTVAFGYVPVFVKTENLQQYGFLFTYFLSGLGGAFAETACIIIVANRFSDRLGTVIASVSTVCGLGCMAGPPLGGVLYDFGSTLEWKFRTPFIGKYYLRTMLFIGQWFECHGRSI
jgi:hypothetical protein